MQATAAEKQTPSSFRHAVPKAWVLWAGAVVIAAQMVAMGLVVSRQVEQAAQRQAALQKVPAPGAATQVLAQQ